MVGCERRGPVGLGLGYRDRCTAEITWAGGFAQRHTFNERNLLHAGEVGKTITIGRGTGFRGGGTVYSRPDQPRRPAVVAAGLVLALIAFVPALFLAVGLLLGLTGGVRRAFRP